MALNYLLHRHQVSLMRADAARCPEARDGHALLARRYAHRIHELTRPDRESCLPLVPLG